MSSVEQATFHLPNLPVGTVTFMLLDVEGSTGLWESAPEAMSAAVGRHYELLDAAIALHGGMRPRSVPRVGSVMSRCSSTGRGDPQMLLDSNSDLYREVRRNQQRGRMWLVLQR